MPDEDLSNLTDGADAAIERLEQLLDQSRRAFLLGAGCSKCAGLPTTFELTKEVFECDRLSDQAKSILNSTRNAFAGTTDAMIEDYLSEIVDHLAIAHRRYERGATQSPVNIDGVDYDAEQLRQAAEEIKTRIAQIISETPASVETHRSFIRGVHQTLRPGRLPSYRSADYFVLNYDTLVEDALALERVPYSDGLEGGPTGWWNPDAYDRESLSARVFKLHGSIDWCQFEDDLTPRRISPGIQSTGEGTRPVLIWPASTKYRETQLDPYAQVAQRFRDALPPRSSNQCVLFVCGYRFEDAHINHELDRALRDSDGELTIVAFTSKPEPSGILECWRSDPVLSQQLVVYARGGFFHGDESFPSSSDLDWWKFEVFARLLEGEK